MMIKKKTWPKQFNAIMDGSKKFDCRLADFDCDVGDIIIFEEWDPSIREYTGRRVSKKITFVLKTKEEKFWSEDEVKEKGFQIFSLE